MPAFDDCLKQVMAIQGTLRASLIDHSSGMTVAAAGRDGPAGDYTAVVGRDHFDPEAADGADAGADSADAGPMEIVRATMGSPAFVAPATPGYVEEKDVAPESTVPTFAAVRLFIDNWRWNGVPFYLRSGKRLKNRVSEIAVQFRAPPHLMFGHQTREAMRPNTLVMRVQPNEGVALNFEVKVPGAAVALTSNIEIAPVDMEFDYANAFGEVSAPAYETLLLDVMIGEATLFTRSDEVEAAWSQPLVFPTK